MEKLGSRPGYFLGGVIEGGRQAWVIVTTLLLNPMSTATYLRKHLSLITIILII